MTPDKTKAALDAFDAIDETLSFIRNMMNETEEIVALNVPSFKSDMDCMIREMRVHGATIRAALTAQAEAQPERNFNYLARDLDIIRVTLQSYKHDVDVDFQRIDRLQSFIRAATAPKPAPHTEDAAVDAFATRMKEKLAKKRAEGRGGWEDKTQCTADYLSQLLREHVYKGDTVDVANLAMMLSMRGEGITQPPTGAQRQAALDAFKTVQCAGDALTVFDEHGATIEAALRAPAAVLQEVKDET